MSLKFTVNFPFLCIRSGCLQAAVLLCLFTLQLTESAQLCFGAERQLSFPEAVRTALKGNAEIQAMASAVAAGKEDIGVARSNLLPKISFEERFLRTDNPTYVFMSKLNERRFTAQDFAIDSLNKPDAVNDFQTAVTLEQPIFAKKAYVGLDMSRTEHAARIAAFRRTQEEIVFRTAFSFLMVSTAREYAAVAERGVEDAREHLRIARLRHDTEAGLYSDVLRANTALTEAEQRKVSAAKNLALAKRSLGLILGLNEPVDIEGGVPELKFLDLQHYATASLARADIRSMELRTENAGKNVLLAEADIFPSFGIGGAYNLNDHRYPLGSEGDSWQLMATLRWTFFEGLKSRHEKAKAGHMASEAQARLKGMKDAVSFQIQEAYLSVIEALKNAELAREALKTAEEGKRLVEIRYENALSPLVDLLDSQLVHDRARMSDIEKKNEHLLALLKLSFQSGLMMEDLNITSE